MPSKTMQHLIKIAHNLGHDLKQAPPQLQKQPKPLAAKPQPLNPQPEPLAK